MKRHHIKDNPYKGRLLTRGLLIASETIGRDYERIQAGSGAVVESYVLIHRQKEGKS